NDGRNYLSGLEGDDTVDARAGRDTVWGGDGDDTLYGGDDAVRVRFEEVYVTVSGGEEYFYKLVPAGTELAGNDDEIHGDDGNDRIDGGAGNDYLEGGWGNDWIYGGDDGLVADRLADGGVGDGFAAFDHDGDEREDGPVFLSNNDYLDGGLGVDFLDGGSGDDELHGGEGDDVLRGGEDGPLNTSNDDYLDGGEGIDDMAGGTGNDRYVVDGFYVETTEIPVYSDCGTLIEGAVTRVWTTDSVFEAAGEGRDTVYSYADYTLPENVEALQLQWFSEAMIGRGNDLDNDLYGNNLDNRLEGGAGNDQLLGQSGNDVLEGGAGDDRLFGGAGDDTYNLGLGDDKDMVVSTGGGFDVVHILDHLASDDLVLSTDGRSVTVAIAGTSDRIVLHNWLGSTDRVRGIVFCEGDALDEAQIEALARQRLLVAADDDVVTEEDAVSITGNVLANDSWSHSSPFVANAGTYIGAYGTLTLQADGTYIYTLSTDALQDLSVGESRGESFLYSVEDEVLASSTAAINITIEGRNDAPANLAGSSGSVTEDAVVAEIFEWVNGVSNGGFENGEDGWSLDGNVDLTGITFDNAFDGRAAAFGAAGEPTLLSQAVETEEGETYLLRFWLLGLDAEGPGAEFSVSWNGEVLMALSGEGPENYAEYVFEVAAAEGGEETLLEFSFRNDPGFWLIDEISVTQFEEEAYV
ncbi:MAG TPA: VCBS domain-containing protein, partial [Thermoanaerobaculia bacterium]